MCTLARFSLFLPLERFILVIPINIIKQLFVLTVAFQTLTPMLYERDPNRRIQPIP